MYNFSTKLLLCSFCWFSAEYTELILVPSPRQPASFPKVTMEMSLLPRASLSSKMADNASKESRPLPHSTLQWTNGCVYRRQVIYAFMSMKKICRIWRWLFKSSSGGIYHVYNLNCSPLSVWRPIQPVKIWLHQGSLLSWSHLYVSIFQTLQSSTHRNCVPFLRKLHWLNCISSWWQRCCIDNHPIHYISDIVHIYSVPLWTRYLTFLLLSVPKYSRVHIPIEIWDNTPQCQHTQS